MGPVLEKAKHDRGPFRFVQFMHGIVKNRLDLAPDRFG